ncbi:MAG TPA: ubiquinol-cytochrome c reductase iron-sulfur subunit [Candidatus Sulfotelmatobacter sp.]|nr:ubiquinol-cytochrome c reductase iron-sulfur subunit [Candidatus Sulfotelmatobacter sp.]
MSDEAIHAAAAEHAEPGNRRDFLYIMTGAFTALGAVLTAWPFISEMSPDKATLAAGGPVDVDLAPLAVGQMMQVVWQSRPIFIVNRTPANLKELQDPKFETRLLDPNSNAPQQPAYARNWHRSIKPEFLVLVGICTHLGCIPTYRPDVGAGDLAPDWEGGYFCPCHGSKYDLSGRVYSGVPAPFNLPVPPHHYIAGTKLRIGENPPGQKFDFDSIAQV